MTHVKRAAERSLPSTISTTSPFSFKRVERPALGAGRTARTAARKSAARLGNDSIVSLVNRLPGLIYRCRNDVYWTMEFLSEGCLELTGYPPQYFLSGKGGCYADIIHPDDQDFIYQEVQRAVAAGNTYRLIYRIITADKQLKWVWEQGNAVRGDAGSIVALEGYITDVTVGKETEDRLRQSEAKLREQAALLDQAREAIIVRDVDHRIRFWNKGAERLYGWTEQEALGKQARELLYDTTEQVDRANRILFEQGAWSGEIVQRRKDGSHVTVEAHWTLVKDGNGQPASIFSINNDITERKMAETKIQKLAYCDALTGLPNRPLLLDRLRHFLETGKRTKQAGALMFIDLDRFKLINDTLGHDAGDLLLRQVALRLSACIRHSDTVARFGGDEFVILLESLSENQDKAALQAEHVAEKIIAAFVPPFQLGAHQHFSSPSIGIAVFKGEEDREDDILKRADMAMYEAKAAGRNTFRFFDPKMQEAISHRLAFEADLRRGSDRQEFVLYYQPQVDRNGNITGAEALLRWQPHSGKLISPSIFIPVAEDSDLILLLGQWALEAACKQLVVWAGDPQTANLTMSVNISARQFRHPDFVAQVLEVLERTGANPMRLKFELTESMLLQDLRDTILKIGTLRSTGVRFSLDDFGTGYSSLSYLKSFPIDQLKIDRSFVKDITTDPNDAAIASSIVALGRSLNLEVLAEGVEIQEQRDFLESRGCHSYQGYLFGHPVPADRFLAAQPAPGRFTA